MVRKTGYTLVEMLAVISVVMILMAILFAIMGPVIQLIYRKRCASQLEQIGRALALYRKDPQHEEYPNPSQVNPVQAVVPYIETGKIFTCPKAPKTTEDQEAIASSYNDWYNYLGFAVGTAPQPITSMDEALANYQTLDNPASGKPDFFYEDKLHSNRLVPNTDFPGLVNKNAGPNTIVMVCTHHGGDKGNYLVLRLSGEVEYVQFEKMTADEQENFWALSKAYRH
ncbi:MAG: type II secretion system protein [Armatimonadota bacterium]